MSKAGQRGSEKRVRETWLTTFDLCVSGSRMLWLLGTTGSKFVPLKRFRVGDRVRVTVELLARTRRGR